MQVYNNILETVGNTPMVKLNNIIKRDDIEVYAKLEGFNPSGSIKDRIALNMINEAEKQGKLKKGQIIIEPTSGNTGIGLAMVASIKGYKLVIVMSESVSVERRKILKAFGADIVLTPGDQGTDGAIRKAHEIYDAEPEKYYMPNQFSNPANYMTHYYTTGPEIWEQTNGKITHFVASLGTSGTLMGNAKYLKEKNPNIKIIEAQPEMGHKIQGLKNMKEAIVPEIYDPTKVDEHIIIETQKAYQAARDIIAKEGIFIGMSSGAAMVAALKIAEEVPSGSVIVVLFPDRGEKYLSTQLFE
ncbi:cysteine synthases family protein [Histomonas meleagridis]|uniref:cysteine synthases family protein n=1 Tax=Histomonas meleagridis TaxID=135588 RepID=UPI003559AFAF|nr:cysteine synthases family protein [Histomonas meleagridis]KAH0801342.1 cysteine synthases family protein [Histomonas meleagridis]